jgi:hypothetical protein
VVVMLPLVLTHEATGDCSSPMALHAAAAAFARLPVTQSRSAHGTGLAPRLFLVYDCMCEPLSLNLMRNSIGTAPRWRASLWMQNFLRH